MAMAQACVEPCGEEPSASICMLCEEDKGVAPYPCDHVLCEGCVQKCQAERMYRCPFCRADQQMAVPSLEYKLLKLLVGVHDLEARENLQEAARMVARSESGATEALQKATAAALPHMVDFHARHFEADACLQLIAMLLNGELTVEGAQKVLGKSVERQERMALLIGGGDGSGGEGGSGEGGEGGGEGREGGEGGEGGGGERGYCPSRC